MVVMEQFLRRKGYGAIILFQFSHSKKPFCRRMNTLQAEINGALTTVMGLVLKSFQEPGQSGFAPDSTGQPLNSDLTKFIEIHIANGAHRKIIA